MEVLLDTNFLITCVKQKIDFETLIFEILREKVEWLVPEEIIGELNKVSEKKETKIKDKDAIKLVLMILDNLSYKKIKLNNKNVDLGIMKYIDKKPIALATLDKGLKKKVSNPLIVILDKDRLGLIK